MAYFSNDRLLFFLDLFFALPLVGFFVSLEQTLSLGYFSRLKREIYFLFNVIQCKVLYKYYLNTIFWHCDEILDGLLVVALCRVILNEGDHTDGHRDHNADVDL